MKHDILIPSIKGQIEFLIDGSSVTTTDGKNTEGWEEWGHFFYPCFPSGRHMHI